MLKYFTQIGVTFKCFIMHPRIILIEKFKSQIKQADEIALYKTLLTFLSMWPGTVSLVLQTPLFCGQKQKTRELFLPADARTDFKLKKKNPKC